MSEQVGADLPEARDGVGQLSKDALRSPAAVDRQRAETSLNCVSRRGAAPEPHGTQATGTGQILRRYAVAEALFAFTRSLPPAILARQLDDIRAPSL